MLRDAKYVYVEVPGCRTFDNDYDGYYTGSRFTALTIAVQSVGEPCNIAVYLHSQKLYFHSISRTSCNKYVYNLRTLSARIYKHPVSV